MDSQSKPDKMHYCDAMMLVNDVVFHCLHYAGYGHTGQHTTNLKNGQPVSWKHTEKVAYRTT